MHTNFKISYYSINIYYSHVTQLQNAAVSGDCLFQSLACTLPNLTHEEVRRDIVEFYIAATTTQEQLHTIAEIHGYKEDLRERDSEIKEPGKWGEGVDVSAFASIHNIAIKVEVLTFIHRKETETIIFFPVNHAGNQVRNAKVASPPLHHNGIDHWSA